MTDLHLGIPDAIPGTPKRCGGCRHPIGDRAWACYPCYDKASGREPPIVCSYCLKKRDQLKNPWYCDECFPQFAHLFEAATPEQIDAALRELQAWTT